MHNGGAQPTEDLTEPPVAKNLSNGEGLQSHGEIEVKEG